MKPLYLYKSGMLKRKDNSLLFKTQEEISIPIEQVDVIYCFGEVNLNKRVLQLLNYHQISMLFFDYYGNCIGRFLPQKPRTGKAITAHVKAVEKEETNTYICQQIQHGSIENMISLLKYYAKKGKEVHETIQKISQYKSKEASMPLLLWEAQIKKMYYSAFDKILKETGFVFERRSKHPPTNEINAMMSYGYSILYATILSIIDQSRLLPELSFIHSTAKTGPSLQFDLADLFKPVLIDRLIFKLIRKRQIKLDHFEYFEDGRCYFNQEGIKIFIHAYHEMLSNTIQVNGKSLSYHSILKREVNHLANYILNISQEYIPYKMRW